MNPKIYSCTCMSTVKCSWGKLFVIFVSKLTSIKLFPHENVGAYRNACNAVQAMKSNETVTHEIIVFELNEFF